MVHPGIATGWLGHHAAAWNTVEVVWNPEIEHEVSVVPYGGGYGSTVVEVDILMPGERLLHSVIFSQLASVVKERPGG